MAEAVILAAIASGELQQLERCGSAALAGLATLRGRWIAFAALLALHPDTEFEALARPLGCGPSLLRQLASCRRAGWWNEADVHRVFVALAEAWDPRAIAGGRDLRRDLSDVLAARSEQASNGGVHEQG